MMENSKVATGPIKDGVTESSGQVETARPDTAPEKVVESGGTAESGETASGKEDESPKDVGASETAAASEEGKGSEAAADKTGTGAAKETGDATGKQIEPTEKAGQPEKLAVAQKQVKKPEETVKDYLAKLNALDVQGKVVKAESGASEEETGAQPKSEQPGVIHWLDEVAKDVTPVRVTKACQDMDKGQLLGDKNLFREFQNIDGIFNDQSKTNTEKLDLSTELLTKFCAYYNFADHKFKAIFANYAIMIGKFLLAMKSFVKGVRKTDKKFPQWGAWATENLSFLGERRRQDYMALAERPDAHSYSYFGVERLLHLVKATAKISGSDKIGTFLSQHNIVFDPGDEEYKVKEFKCEVDAALFVEKAKENNLNLDITKVKGLIELGAEVDRKMISECRQIADAGGDPNKYLDARFKNKGKDIDYWAGDNLISKLITLGERLQKGYKTLAGDPNSLMKLELAQLDPLLEAINRLKEARNKLAEPPAGGDSTSGSEKE